MALAIHLSTFISGGYTGDVIRWRLKEQASGAYIDQHEEPGPHGQEYNFSFTQNLRDIVYTIELYDVPPLATVGTLIKAHDVTVSTSTILFDPDIEIIVGHGQPQDPVDGDDTTPNISQLIGRKWKVIHRSRGKLLINREPEYSMDIVNGNFSLLGGQKFDIDDIYIIEFDIEYVINPPGTASNGPFNDVQLITVSQTVLSTDMGKLFIIESTELNLVLQLSTIADYPEKIPLTIQNSASDANTINVVIKSFGAETIKQNGWNDNSFILSRGDEAKLIKLGGQWYGTNQSPDARHRGKVDFIPCYPMINRVAANGQEDDASKYPGLIQALTRFAVSSLMGSLAAWNLGTNEFLYVALDHSGAIFGPTRAVNPNQTHFALYNVGGIAKIRFPKLDGMFVRALKFAGDPDRNFNTPFGRQAQAAPSFVIVPKLGQRGSVNNDANGGGFGYENNNPNDVPSYPVNIGHIDNNSHVDLRPDNFAQVAAIII